MKRSLGQTLLAVYLIMIGVIALFGISLGKLAIVMPVLALVAGIFLLMGK